MERSLKVHPPRMAEAYYQRLPMRAHRTGDLWRCLPVFDLLPRKHVTGLVITPACDLANDKTPTITYLPVVPVSEYLLSVASYSCLRPVLLEHLQKAKRTDIAVLLPRAPHPKADDIRLILQEIGTSSSVLREKIESGLRVLLNDPADSFSIRLKHFAACLGERWQKNLERFVANAYSDDIHFLPPDGEDATIGAVSRPSVVLFRLPLTLSHAWFDAQMENEQPKPDDPLKSTTLNAPFLTDLLTRFARLYIRIGSPDLADESVTDLVTQIDGEQLP